MIRRRLRTATGDCEIRIGRGLAGRLSFDAVPFLITDRNAERFVRRFSRKGRRFLAPPGERSKSLAVFGRLVDSMARAGVDRDTPMLAAGGGVVSDLAGFAAAVFKRGVPLHVLPTTLLAQVDAAIGGKNGLDLPRSKNALGTIRQPASVTIDPEVLSTLPPREFVSGLAEVIKCGVIRDPALFALLERRMDRLLARDPATLEEAIRRAVFVKARIVARDESDSGEREILNYGHTVGHALEAASGYRRRHGEAVALGMMAAARIAQDLGLADGAFVERQQRVIASAGLPVRMDAAAPGILRALRHDKKRRDGVNRFVLPLGVGRVRRGVPVTEAQVARALR